MSNEWRNRASSVIIRNVQASRALKNCPPDIYEGLNRVRTQRQLLSLLDSTSGRRLIQRISCFEGTKFVVACAIADGYLAHQEPVSGAESLN